MRYFMYKNTDKNRKNALKEQYKALTENEKRTLRKQKTWERISVVSFFAVFILCMAAGIFLIKSIPQPDSLLWAVLVGIGTFFIVIAFLIISGFVSYGLTMPLWKRAVSFHMPSMKKEIFSKACGHLRHYYKLQEPYIVTKCFDATNKRFKNHDVCIFVVNDELRMTTDLLRGFLHGERDLGCYVFKKEEITLSKQRDGERLMVELKARKVAFLLGYRAKSFIEKNFTGE